MYCGVMAHTAMSVSLMDKFWKMPREHYLSDSTVQTMFVEERIKL